MPPPYAEHPDSSTDWKGLAVAYAIETMNARTVEAPGASPAGWADFDLIDRWAKAGCPDDGSAGESASVALFPSGAFTDEELTVLALEADPEQSLGPDAVQLDLSAAQPGAFLPEWYMPRVMATRVRGWRMPLVFMIVGAFLLIDAFGLCITYGQLVAA
jgi:hypothetical protein